MKLRIGQTIVVAKANAASIKKELEAGLKNFLNKLNPKDEANINGSYQAIIDKHSIVLFKGNSALDLDYYSPEDGAPKFDDEDTSYKDGKKFFNEWAKLKKPYIEAKKKLEESQKGVRRKKGPKVSTKESIIVDQLEDKIRNIENELSQYATSWSANVKINDGKVSISKIEKIVPLSYKPFGINRKPR